MVLELPLKNVIVGRVVLDARTVIFSVVLIVYSIKMEVLLTVSPIQSKLSVVMGYFNPKGIKSATIKEEMAATQTAPFKKDSHVQEFSRFAKSVGMVWLKELKLVMVLLGASHTASSPNATMVNWSLEKIVTTEEETEMVAPVNAKLSYSTNVMGLETLESHLYVRGFINAETASTSLTTFSSVTTATWQAAQTALLTLDTRAPHRSIRHLFAQR